MKVMTNILLVVDGLIQDIKKYNSHWIIELRSSLSNAKNKMD